MTKLKVHQKPAQSGETNSLVVFLHGYGADGGDLLGLSEPLGQHMPDTAFAAPDAPNQSTANPQGYQWAPVPWIDGSNEVDAARDFAASADLVDQMLTGLLEEHGLTPDRLIVLGFSQGCMLSLHVAPRRPEPIAGIVGISGRLLFPERLDEVVSKPPVMLIHGDADDVVPFASMGEAGDALQGAGFTVYGHVMRGTGHGIAPDGLSAALGFMLDQLGIGTSGP
jgi:phospholipase/carboxylesterase